MGDAFDIVGERKQIDYLTGRRWRKEKYEITLRNHKDKDVEVKIREKFWRWANWKIIDSSHPYEKRDSQTIEFSVKIEAKGDVRVTYMVKYWW
ncbi:MAG: hypothetical protein DRI22_04390 [Caldiserica bacterium]|nr:MAG: hypothetical protein DRI22_04390 [Caldisericota bacterium]